MRSKGCWADEGQGLLAVDGRLDDEAAVAQELEHHFPVDGVVFHQQDPGVAREAEGLLVPLLGRGPGRGVLFALNSLAVNQKQLPWPGSLVTPTSPPSGRRSGW